MARNLGLIPEILRLLVKSGGNPLVVFGQVLGVLPRSMPGGLSAIRRVLGSHQTKMLAVWLGGKLEGMSREDAAKLLSSAGVKAKAAAALISKRKQNDSDIKEKPATNEDTEKPDEIRKLLDAWKTALDSKPSAKGKLGKVFDRFKS